MQRKVYSALLEWKKNRRGKTALRIDGARRVGKSYIAEEFAKREYRSYVFLDFYSVGNEIRELFRDKLNDLDTFFSLLSLYTGVPLYERETLIILDEVQLFPRAREAIKALVADGRYDYIETGSLISIHKNVKDILIPSEEEPINMYPMDFEEFCLASGNDMLVPYLRECFSEFRAPEQGVHRKAMDLFRQYMVVGGMPQVVNEFVENRDFTAMDRVKRSILSLYRDDIAKFAAGYEAKVRSIFDEIPGQLQRKEKKFKLSDLRDGARFREYESAFFWLSDGKIINPCYNASEPSIGLKMNEDRTTLKCYMGDTGLLISHAFDENGVVSEEIYKKLMLDKLELNKGMLMENVVSQMLVASGHKLFFYSNPDRNDKDSRMEIDFLIAKSKATNRHNISPIEVKSGTRYSHVSLDKFRKKYSEQLHTPYVIHKGEMKEENGIKFLPLYMAMFL